MCDVPSIAVFCSESIQWIIIIIIIIIAVIIVVIYILLVHYGIPALRNLTSALRGNFLYTTCTKEFTLGGPDSQVMRAAPCPHTVRMTKGLKQ